MLSHRHFTWLQVECRCALHIEGLPVTLHCTYVVMCHQLLLQCSRLLCVGRGELLCAPDMWAVDVKLNYVLTL